MDLLVIGPYGQVVTGTSTVVTEVVNNLSKDISVLAVVPRKRRETGLINYHDGNIRVIFQPMGSLPGVPGSYQYVEISRLVLRLSKLSFKPDLVWVHNAAGFIAYSLSKFRRVPSIATVHGVWGAFYQEETRTRGFFPLTKMMAFQSKWLQKREFAQASMITTYSQYLKDMIHAINPEAKVKIIPNGVNIDIFKPMDLPREKTILYVGRMAKIKGIHLLIESIQKVFQECPDWRLCLAGGIFDQPRSFFEKYMTPETKSRIEFRGRVPYHSVPELLNRSSIFVMPTIRDGFEIALMEAMATGIPCVTTDSFERTELYGGYAEMVPANNPYALANKLIEIIKDYPKYRNIKSQLHRINRAQEFDWKNISKRYEQLFRKLAR